jgi:hypothetical protein
MMKFERKRMHDKAISRKDPWLDGTGSTDSRIVPWTSNHRIILQNQYQAYRKRNGLQDAPVQIPSILDGSAAESTDAQPVASTVEADRHSLSNQPFSNYNLTLWDLALLRSSIQGMGLFSLITIPPNTLITEYMGEVIGHGLGDGREKKYDRQGIGCYFFRLDDEWIIDATKKGNVSRYINHSCAPNCYAVIITCDKGKKIVLIFSIRTIHPMEELTYDYKFSMEDGAKIACHCGAPTCRGYMN